MKSLASYLHLSLTIGVVIVLTSVWLLGYFAVSTLTEQFIIDKLNHDIESLLASLDFQHQNAGQARERMAAVYSQPFSGHYYLVRYSGNKALTSRSLWDYNLTITDLVPGQSQTRIVVGPQQQKLLLISRGFVRKDQNITIAVAEDMVPFNKRTAVFTRYFALLSVAGLVLLLLLQRQVVRNIAHKLGNVRRDILALSRGEKQRLNEQVPAEVQPLATEINHLLTVMQDRQERSRNALGNLAHALKTPLALLLQVLERDRALLAPEVAIATAQANRIHELIQRELKRARIVGSGSSIAAFDTHKELPDLIAALKTVHHKKNITVQLELDPELRPFGEREDMLELLGNLLDNAFKWARCTVRCQIRIDRAVHIQVEDDGQGLDEQGLQKLSNRGQRLDETVEGSGLGLSIVSDIVQQYHGRIKFGRSLQLLGLSAQIEFPIQASIS